MGIGLGYLSAVVIVQTYFEKKRAFAGSIASCGVGVGVLALAPILTLLENKFGWSYTMMTLGALMLTCIPLAMSFRPLITVKSELSEICNENKKVEAQHDGANVFDNSGRSNLMKLILQKLPKPPKILYNPIFITCLVANFFMNIGYSVPYVYTVVSIESSIMQIKTQKHLNSVNLLESCH